MSNLLLMALALTGAIDGTTKPPEAETRNEGRPEPRKRFLAGLYATTSHGVGLNALVLVKPLDVPEAGDPEAGFVPVLQFQVCYNLLIRPGARGSASPFDPLAVSLPGRVVNPTFVLTAHSKLLREGWNLDRFIAEGVPPEEEPPARIGLRPR